MDQIVKADVNDDEIAPFMQDINRYFEYVEKEDLIKKIVSLEFGKFLAYYADAPEIEVVKKQSSSEKKQGTGNKNKGATKPESGFRRLFINLGKADGFYPGELMQFLNRNVEGYVSVGHIDLLTKFAYFDVLEKDAKRVMNALNGQRYKGREVRCNDSVDKKTSGKRQVASDKRQGTSDKRQATSDKKKGKKPAKKKDDWKEFLNPKSMKLKGEIPDFTEEGWARRHPKKK